MLCGTPFIWRTPRGASSVPTSDSHYEYSECGWGEGRGSKIVKIADVFKWMVPKISGVCFVTKIE